MRIVVAGSRDATQEQVRQALERCPWLGFLTTLISGAARGADQFGEMWAAEQGIPVQQYPADWSQGKRAGPLRNKQMAENAEGLIAVWDGTSRGTDNMIQEARRRGLRVFVLNTADGSAQNIPPSGGLAEVWAEAEERAAIKEYVGGLTRREAEATAGRECTTTVGKT